MSGFLEIPGFPAINLPTSGTAHTTWMTPVENIFSYFGMTTPFYRLVGVAGGVGILIYFLKPSGLFSDDEAKPWALWSGEPDAVLFPWWFVSLLLGLCAATFI